MGQCRITASDWARSVCRSTYCASALLLMRVAGQQPAAKAAQVPQRGLADAPGPQHPDRHARQLPAAQALDEEVLRVDAALLQLHLSQEREQEQHRVLGDGVGGIRGHIGRGDPRLLQGAGVQVIVPRGARQQKAHAALPQGLGHRPVHGAARVDGHGLAAADPVHIFQRERLFPKVDGIAQLLVIPLVELRFVCAMRGDEQLHSSVPLATSFLTQSDISCRKSRGVPPVWKSSTVLSCGK